MSHDHSHSHGHHHHHHDGCCSHSHHDADCCHSESSCDSHHHSCCHEHEHEHFYEELIELADEAWMELLKAKIKDQIQQTGGAHLDQLAKIVSDANHGRWKNKLAKKRGVGEFKDRIRDFFNKGAE